jgi:hypothetical protein
MTQSPVATEVHEALDVHGDFTAEVALNGHVSDLCSQSVHFTIGQFTDLGIFRNTGVRAQATSLGAAHAKYVCQRDNSVLVIRYVDAGNTSHPSFSNRLSSPCAATLAPIP